MNEVFTSEVSRVPSFKSEPGIRLLRALLRAQRTVLGRHGWIEREGLGLAEFDLIATLGNTDGLRMSEAADRMITTPQNVTRLARALEERGLVTRQRSPVSGREVLLRLTRAGEAIFASLYPRATAFTIELFDRALSRKEQQALTRTLDRLTGTILESTDPWTRSSTTSTPARRRSGYARR